MKDSCLWALERKGVTGSYEPSWRSLIQSGLLEPILAKWGLAYLAYTCTLVCWNRFWLVGAGLPGVHLYSGLLEPVLASGGWPTWRTLVLWSAGTGSGRWRPPPCAWSSLHPACSAPQSGPASRIRPPRTAFHGSCKTKDVLE
jgi:hypothetical protein